MLFLSSKLLGFFSDIISDVSSYDIFNYLKDSSFLIDLKKTLRNRILVAFILLPIAVIQAYGQEKIKVTLDPSDALTGYYYKVLPTSNEIDRVLFLMPGFSQPAESIFTESMLPYVASANDVLTVALAGGHTIFANEPVVKNINLVIDDVLKEHPILAEKPWIMGGFSAGGTIALRFVEHCKQFPLKSKVNFAGVFTVDSPVDIVDLWKYFERELEKNASEAGVNEAKYVMAKMEEQEGTPFAKPQRYAELTPFNLNMEKGNEQFLKDTAVRVYHDVDIAWQLQNRRRSVFDSNYLNASEMINRLLLVGNDRAEFIQSKQKGYRSNGMRHTHAWSIVDEVECIQWLKNL